MFRKAQPYYPSLCEVDTSGSSLFFDPSPEREQRDRWPWATLDLQGPIPEDLGLSFSRGCVSGYWVLRIHHVLQGAGVISGDRQPPVKSRARAVR